MRKFICCVIVFLIASRGFSQELTVNASRTKVAVGEQFQVTFSLNGAGSNFRQPVLGDFDVYSGPNQSQSMQFINGTMSQSISFSYILGARKEGKFSISGASIVVNGKKVDAKPLVIEVKGTVPQQHQPGQQARTQGGHQEAATGDLGDDVFLKCVLDKRKAFVGEQLIATFKIYFRVNIIDNNVTKVPVLNGFWSEDLTSKSKEADTYTENFEGVTYTVADLKKTALFPQRAGIFEIDPLVMDCIIRQRVSGGNSIFDQFFGGGYQNVRIALASKPIKVQVMPLPDGKPVGFTGGVGTFSIESKVNKQNVKANEAVNLTITINGKGNLKLIDPVKPEFNPDIESYDPKITDRITSGSNGISGSRTYDFLLIPRHSGDYDLPQIPFAYFDPQQNKYITLTTPAFSLHVEKGSDPASGQDIVTGRSQEDIKVLGSDIRYIKTDQGKIIQTKDVFFGSGLHYSMLALPFVLFSGLLVFHRRVENSRKNPTITSAKRANKVALKRLANAQIYLDSNQNEKYYNEVYLAINGYLADKLHLPPSVRSRQSIIDSMESRGVDTFTINKFIDIIDQCEFARYAPLKNPEGMRENFETAKQVIIKVEEELG